MTSKSTGFRIFSFSAVTIIVALVVLGGMASLSSAASGNPAITLISGVSNTGAGGSLADTFALLAIVLSIAGAGSALYLLKPEQEPA